jgi:hypothetical protein
MSKRRTGAILGSSSLISVRVAVSFRVACLDALAGCSRRCPPGHAVWRQATEAPAGGESGRAPTADSESQASRTQSVGLSQSVQPPTRSPSESSGSVVTRLVAAARAPLKRAEDSDSDSEPQGRRPGPGAAAGVSKPESLSLGSRLPRPG